MIPALDNIRALAVISVFILHFCHSYECSFFFFDQNGGWFGIQLFFILSGYLIIRSKNKNSLKDYTIARILRIFPAYIFITLFVIFLHKHEYDFISIHALANLFMLQHIFPVSLIRCDVLHVTWTLTIELFWYGIAPIFLILLKRFPNKTLIITIISSSFFVYLSKDGYFDFLFLKHFEILGLSNIAGYRDFFITNSFIGQLPYFVLGGYLLLNKEVLLNTSKVTLIVLVITGIIVSEVYLNSILFPNILTGISLASLFILFFKHANIKILPFAFLAKISYSFYLLHFPIIIYVKNNLKIENVYFGLVYSLLIAVGLSTLFYYIIEKNFIKLYVKK